MMMMVILMMMMMMMMIQVKPHPIGTHENDVSQENDDGWPDHHPQDNTTIIINSLHTAENTYFICITTTTTIGMII